MEEEVLILPKSEISYQNSSGYRQQLLNPAIAKAANVEKQLDTVIEDKHLDDHKKYKIYQHLLEELLKLREENVNRPRANTTPRPRSNSTPPPSTVKNNEEEAYKLENLQSKLENILSNKLEREKSVKILQQLSEKNILPWNKNTGVLNIDGKEISNSNIVDVIQYFTSNMPIKSKPIGAKELGNIFRNMNLPSNLVHYKKKAAVMKKKDSISPTKKVNTSFKKRYPYTRSKKKKDKKMEELLAMFEN